MTAHTQRDQASRPFCNPRCAFFLQIHAGELFKLDGWKYIEGSAKAGTLHLIGLLSDGGVHSR